MAFDNPGCPPPTVWRDSLHTQLEAEIFDKLKGLLPDALVKVGYKHIDRFGQGSGPEVDVRVRIHRNNRSLETYCQLHTGFMPRDMFAKYVAEHAVLRFQRELML